MDYGEILTNGGSTESVSDDEDIEEMRKQLVEEIKQKRLKQRQQKSQSTASEIDTSLPVPDEIASVEPEEPSDFTNNKAGPSTVIPRKNAPVGMAASPWVNSQASQLPSYSKEKFQARALKDVTNEYTKNQVRQDSNWLQLKSISFYDSIFRY